MSYCDRWISVVNRVSSVVNNCFKGHTGCAISAKIFPGGTLIFHTYVGSGHFFGFQIFEFQFFGGFSEKLIFFGLLEISDIFGG